MNLFRKILCTIQSIFNQTSYREHKMKLEHIIESLNQSILLIKETEYNEIVIAVPHHAPLGIEELPCKEHKIADENT